MFVGENGRHSPTSTFIGNDAPTAPTTIYTQPTQFGSNESAQVEVYQDHSSSNQINTSGIFKEDYNQALDCINSWKNAYDSWII